MKRSVALVATLLSLPTASATAAGPPTGRIAFERIIKDTQQFHIMVSDGVGGAVRQLTTGAGPNIAPEWSPDGTRVAYTGFATGSGYEIYVVDADGGNVRGATATPYGALTPAWSPDGTKIAFSEPSSDGTANRLAMVPANGVEAAPTELTALSTGVSDIHPAWSPDGESIAFSRRTGGGYYSVMVMPAAGGQATAVTTPPEMTSHHSARWSPDGKRLAYVHTPQRPFAGTDAVARVVDLATGTDVAIAGTENAVGAISWSADGTWLVFGAMPMPETPPLQVFAVPLAGGARVAVAASNTQDRDPDWEPLADADGDGLFDLWETKGIDDDGDGTADLDLKAMGADPQHKDVFVELDYMSGNPIDQAATDAVVTAFENAPVANPDGTHGINLHIDNGPGSVMNPVTNATWGALSDQEVLPAGETLSGVAASPFDWAPFDAFRDNHFLGIRRKAFHYAISGVETPASPGGRARTGNPPDVGGSDFILLIPEKLQGLDQESLRFQAGTFMHELGHNLGLKHGGGEDVPEKPNYLSVMNYHYQGGWLRRGGLRVLDYSRFDFPLDETALNEQTGYGQTAGPAGFAAISYCPDGTLELDEIGMTGVDWTCDGTTSATTVQVDVNHDAAITPLASHLDWPALRFSDGSIGDGAKGAATSPANEEPPAHVILAFAAVLGGPIERGPFTQPPVLTSPPALPLLSALRVRPARLRPARSGRSLVRRLPRHRGARITFRLTLAARVTFTIQRRVGRRWTRQRGSFSTRARKGANNLRFSGRLRKRALRPGRYRLLARPQSGKTSHAAFRVR